MKPLSFAKAGDSQKAILFVFETTEGKVVIASFDDFNASPEQVEAVVQYARNEEKPLSIAGGFNGGSVFEVRELHIDDFGFTRTR